MLSRQAHKNKKRRVLPSFSFTREQLSLVASAEFSIAAYIIVLVSIWIKGTYFYNSSRVVVVLSGESFNLDLSISSAELERERERTIQTKTITRARYSSLRAGYAAITTKDQQPLWLLLFTTFNITKTHDHHHQLYIYRRNKKSPLWIDTRRKRFTYFWLLDKSRPLWSSLDDIHEHAGIS